jgi:hypothetical protein
MDPLTEVSREVLQLISVKWRLMSALRQKLTCCILWRNHLHLLVATQRPNLGPLT